MSTKDQIEEKRTENITPERQRLLQQDSQAPKREIIVSIEVPTQDEEKRRRSTISMSGSRKGIYWRSPITMILAFLLGLGSALALHGYYSFLDGKEVGDNFQQQNALRIGTALAFMTQTSLVGSIYFAYVQCLWRALKSSPISVRAVDAGFDVTSSLLSFTNVEMLSKLRLASFLALIAWCIPIASLITPATLNVNSVMQVGSQMVNVSTLQIAQAADYFNFAYTFPTQGQASQNVQVYSGPRTILTRLAVATATTGQILSLPAPFINATYQQNFYGPYVQCQIANSTIANQIDMAAERAELALDPSIEEVSNEYFAFVPALVDVSGLSLDSGIQVANLSDVNGALNASNQLWMKFPRYPPNVTILNVTDKAYPNYLSCELYNASYQVNFSWVNGIQSMNMPEPEVVDVVPYPTNGSSITAYNESLAYSAFMWALSSQLVGSMGFYQSTSSNGTGHSILSGINADNQPSSGNNTTNTIFSEIYTNLDQTSLLGSSDFNSYFIKNHALHGQTDRLFSPQRLQDMAYARNRTLDVLIRELSSNITLSLIIDPLLAPSTMTNVTTTIPENIYSYHPFDVLLAYALAISFALLANILGIFAYIFNNASHENSFSSIVCTTYGIHLSGLKAHEKLGELPLDPKVARRELQWYMRGKAGAGGYGFHLV